MNTLKVSSKPVKTPVKVIPLTAHDPNQIATKIEGTIDLVRNANMIAIIGGRVETQG